jgi:hypothetical protein
MRCPASFFCLLLAALAAHGQAVDPLKAEAFDKLWDAFDRDYAMFVLRPEADWAKLREQYRPKALEAKSTEEFAAVCAELLKPLRDLHVWLTVAGQNVPVFNRPRSANSNPSAHQAILGELVDESRGLQWAITWDKLGFIAIRGWNHSDLPARCDEVMEEMRHTRGLIVDVRLNGGGSENLAEEVAGRFLKQEFVYAYSQFRNGPKHTDLTEKFERKVAPRGPWRYNRPVILLIGQKCMSSNESFIAMMSGGSEVTTMGDHTCGSSGNPRIVNLPLEMTISVPRWIDYLPDGTPLDERGFRPQVPFKPSPGAFEGQRDDLLSAALERLRQAPLADKPVEGPAATHQDASRPAEPQRSPAALPDSGEDLVATSATPATSTAPPASPPSLRVAVDPRVELLSLLFFLAGNPEYSQGRVESYSDDAEKQFGGFRDHAAVQLAHKLRNTRGVSYDACMSMAVHLSDAYQLQPIVPLYPWPEALDHRWTAESARNFLAAARQFVKDAAFKQFIERHQTLYQTTTSRMKALMEKDGHLQWFQDYFGERPKATFTVALGLLNGGCCYGPHCRDAAGREELFCILGVWQTDAQGLPEFTRDMLGTVVHEFCHSYANAIIHRHWAELKPAGDKLFEHVADEMHSQAYGNAQTMLCESLVRACVVRYRLRYEGAEAAQREIRDQKKRGFLWMEELSNRLGDYEAHRDRYPTLETFSPRLVSFFKEHAEQDHR